MIFRCVRTSDCIIHVRFKNKPEDPKCGMDEVCDLRACNFQFYTLDRKDSAKACLEDCILKQRPDLRRLMQ